MKITDYAFLFQNPYNKKTSLFGKGSSVFTSIGSFQLSNLNSSAVQSQLKAAGINTNSKQYKAVISNMMKGANGNGAMYTNIQAIKNQMKYYDKDGDWIDPTTGLSGLLVTEENAESRKQIISIPESSRQEMFDLTKKEFIRENGVANGDTTKRSDVYTHLYRKTEKNDRLKAGYTMEQYERAYSRAMYDAVRAADPNWKIGMPIPKGALDGVTRESVERNLVQLGNTLVSKTNSSVASASAQSSGVYSGNSIARVENAFKESLKNYNPGFAQKEEKAVEYSDSVRADKIKRLEQQLKDGTFKAGNDDLDMKA